MAQWRTHRGDSPLFHTQVAIQTRISATSALLHSVLPFATTPEPDQAALATELVAICSAWSALDTQRSLWHGGVLTAVTPQPAPSKYTHKSRSKREDIRDLCTDGVNHLDANYEYSHSPWAGRATQSTSTSGLQRSPAGSTDLPSMTPLGVADYFDTKGQAFSSPQF